MKRLISIAALVAFIVCSYALADTVGAFIYIVSSNPATCTPGQFYWNTTSTQLLVCPAMNTITAVSPLKGATGTIAGTLQVAGGCNSGTASMPGATQGQPVNVTPTDGSFIGGAFTLRADVTSSGMVTVNICAVVAGTPPSKAYNVEIGP